MHSLRFNPVLNQWMLFGPPPEHTLRIHSAHHLGIGRNEHFFAVSHPESPFSADPPDLGPSERGLLHPPKAAIGEYELLLQHGSEEPVRWSVGHWEAWIALLQHRLLQLQHNPLLRHVQVSLDSGLLTSVHPYQRAGDVIATAEPLSGFATLPVELTARIPEREPAFVLAANRFGCLYVPSAPTYDDEIWYLPSQGQPSVAGVHGSSRTALAEALHAMLGLLGAAHLQFDWVLRIHTELIATGHERTWWAQLYRQPGGHMPVLQVRRPPEHFVQLLRQALESNR